MDRSTLSGSILHGDSPETAEISEFGPMPAECALLDGVLLAAKAEVLRRSGVAFDERFEFDFDDMDFCRSARERDLTLGTWPIALVHQRLGQFGSERWKSALGVYRQKWGG